MNAFRITGMDVYAHIHTHIHGVCHVCLYIIFLYVFLPMCSLDIASMYIKYVSLGLLFLVNLE